MELSTVQIVLAFVVAFIAGMDSILDSWQFHRPLLACTLMGLVLGDLTTGVIIGGTLELLALGWANIGAAVAPDSALASVISTLLVIVAKQEIPTAIALAIPLAAAGQVLSIFIRTITITIQHAADRSAKTGNIKSIERLHLSGLIFLGLRVALPALLVLLSAGTQTTQQVLDSIPSVISQGLNVAGGVIVVIGYAMVINMMKANHLMPFFFGGFVVAAFTNFNLVALGVIGTIMAILYIQMHPKYNKSKEQVISNQVQTTRDDQLD